MIEVAIVVTVTAFIVKLCRDKYKLQEDLCTTTQSYERLSESYTCQLNRAQHWHKLYQKRTQELTEVLNESKNI